MNVLYTCDTNYIWIMGISVISLYENNKSVEELVVYLIGENITDENKQILNEVASRYYRQIVVIDVPQLDIPESLVSVRWPLSAFTRLYSAQLLPENIDRILYLDCDTIICGNIELLENVAFDNNIILGIKDCIGSLYKKNIGLDENEIYINAGVLLLNLDELRKVDIKVVIDQYMNRYMELINYADQDILNGIFKGKIGVLEPKYDVMTIDVVHTYEEIFKLRKPTNFYQKEELVAAVNNPLIIHYTTNMRVVRPWFSNTDHPFKKEFRDYMKISPWKDRKLGEMKFTSQEAKFIGVVDKLPRMISYNILGFIHADLKPFIIKIIFLLRRRRIT